MMPRTVLLRLPGQIHPRAAEQCIAHTGTNAFAQPIDVGLYVLVDQPHQNDRFPPESGMPGELLRQIGGKFGGHPTVERRLVLRLPQRLLRTGVQQWQQQQEPMHLHTWPPRFKLTSPSAWITRIPPCACSVSIWIFRSMTAGSVTPQTTLPDASLPTASLKARR